MKNRLTILCLLILVSAHSQWVNPIQIRPGTNGQTMQTVDGYTVWANPVQDASKQNNSDTSGWDATKANLRDSAAALRGALVPNTRNITINGVSQSLSANRTWNIPLPYVDSNVADSRYIRNQVGTLQSGGFAVTSSGRMLHMGLNTAPTLLYALRHGGNFNSNGSSNLGGFIYADPVIGPSITQTYYGIIQDANVGATTTLTNYLGYLANNLNITAGGSVTTAVAFDVSGNFTGASTSIGYRGRIQSGLGRYNLYMLGTADNYLAGNLGLNTTAPIFSLTLANTTTGTAYYNTSDLTVNYERVREYWSGNTYNIQVERGGTGVQRPIKISASRINLSTISVFADNAAALAGGLVAGDVYRTATGQLMITY